MSGITAGIAGSSKPDTGPPSLSAPWIVGVPMLRELLTEIADFLPWALSAVQVAGVAALFWLRTTFVGSKRFAGLCRDGSAAGGAEEELRVYGAQARSASALGDIYNLKLLLKDLEGKQNALVEQNRGIAASLKRVENQLAMLFEHHIGERK